MRARSAGAALVLALAACGIRFATPRARERDARFGRLAGSGPALSADAVCRNWRGTVGARDPAAVSHISFPETDPAAACYTRVTYGEGPPRVGPVPSGCAYPDASQRAALTEVAMDLDARAPRLDTLFPCALRPEQREAARRHNALVFRAMAQRAARPGAVTYPYAAIVAPGFGWRDQALTSVADWRPGDACHVPAPGDVERLGVNVHRTRAVAEALRAGVAPVAIVSGSAVHSRMVEAFAMLYLLRCQWGVRADQVLLEPCADHTHTNLRNSARWLVAMRARAGYLVTDGGIQYDYLQEWNGFELIGGGLDHRSMRDWGYVMGSWRQAAAGEGGVGFWFTPYRFWAEPREGLGSLTCVNEG